MSLIGDLGGILGLNAVDTTGNSTATGSAHQVTKTDSTNEVTGTTSTTTLEKSVIDALTAALTGKIGAENAITDQITSALGSNVYGTDAVDAVIAPYERKAYDQLGQRFQSLAGAAGSADNSLVAQLYSGEVANTAADLAAKRYELLSASQSQQLSDLSSASGTLGINNLAQVLSGAQSTTESNATTTIKSLVDLLTNSTNVGSSSSDQSSGILGLFGL